MNVTVPSPLSVDVASVAPHVPPTLPANRIGTMPLERPRSLPFVHGTWSPLFVHVNAYVSSSKVNGSEVPDFDGVTSMVNIWEKSGYPGKKSSRFVDVVCGVSESSMEPPQVCATASLFQPTATNAAARPVHTQRLNGLFMELLLKN
ncbi:MAG: hypothetical protein ACNS61_11230 [Candidatus Wenzhouxiangella sp. M2_3B_020]